MNSGTQCHSGQTWQNWAKTLSAQPQCLFYPESADDVVTIVNQAKTEGKKIRVAGSGHSWSPLVPINQYIVVVEKMNTVQTGTDANGNPTVTVQPGATMGDVAKATMAANIAFPTNGVLPDIQEGGFVAAGCHGTGWQQPTIPDLVTSMDVVLASGEKRTFSVETDGEDVMNKVRVHLGALGVVTSMTFTIQEMFWVHNIDETKLMTDVVDRNDPSKLKQLVADNEYVELFWFPFNSWTLFGGVQPEKDEVWVKRYNTETTQQPSEHCPPTSFWDELATLIGGKFLEILPTFPYLTPGFLKGAWTFAPKTSDCYAYVTHSFHYPPTAFPVLDFSWALPIDDDFSNATQSWYDMVDGVYDWAKQDKFPVNVTGHARFIKNSQSLLSPAYQPAGSSTHTCFIEFLSVPGTQDYDEFANFMGQKWMALGGRPHWAKLFQNVEGIIPYTQRSFDTGSGNNMKEFKAFRDSLDPNGMFMNGFLDTLFQGL